MATTPPPQPDDEVEPDADDYIPMTGGVPDGHAMAAQRNADSMNAMQQAFRQAINSVAY